MLRKLWQPILMLTSSLLLLACAILTIHAQQQPVKERAKRPTRVPTPSPISQEKAVEGESPFAAEAARQKGGMVKAMLFVDKERKIVRCFNSTLAGNAASTKPCGFTIGMGSDEQAVINFGFQINDRFILSTPVTAGNGWYWEREKSQTAPIEFHPSANDTVLVTTSGWRMAFMIFVF
jgi:hypothetical protein